MKYINKWFRSFFGFHQKEINGFVFLSVIMILSLSTPYLFGYFVTQEPYDFTEDERILQQLIAQSTFKKDTFNKEVSYVKKEMKTSKKWVEKPVYEKQQQRVNYLKNIPKKVFKKKRIEPIAVNSSDTLLFQQIHGIGRVLSQRIIRYRERLGGFYDLQQLKEVYGVDTSLIDQNMKYFLPPDTMEINKIAINDATVKELVRHPYISYKQAIAIVNYRQQHGVYHSMEEVMRIHLMSALDQKRLAPYLSFEISKP